MYSAPLPRRPWRVKPWVYRVQHGDNLLSIAQQLTASECPCRVEQLLGANLHKDFGGPLGSPLDECRIVANLTSGEPLFVPSDWPDAPGYMGDRIELFTDLSTAGRPTMVDPTAPYIGALTSYWDQVVAPVIGGTTALPTGTNQTDVINVVAAWYPYLRNYLPAQVPPIPNIVPGSWPMPGIDPQQATWYANLLKAFQQAISLLQNTSCTSDIAKMIPWDMVLNQVWNKVPWGEIGKWANRMGWTQSQMWAFLASAMGKTPGMPSMSSRLSQSGAIAASTDLLEQDFSSGAWGEIPFSDVLWQSQNFGLLTDPAFLQCLKENPAQANMIAQCKECFAHAGSDKFKDYLCNPQLDPCDCKVVDGKDDGGNGEIIIVTEKSSSWPRILFVGAGILSLAAAAITYGGVRREKSR